MENFSRFFLVVRENNSVLVITHNITVFLSIGRPYAPSPSNPLPLYQESAAIYQEENGKKIV